MWTKDSEAHSHCARLEAALEELKSAASDSTDRHLLEYLFLPGSPEQLQQLAEEGFPQPPPWLLTNSLRLALEGHLKPGQSLHVLIAKVLMTRGCKVRCKGQGLTLSFETCLHTTRCWNQPCPIWNMKSEPCIMQRDLVCVCACGWTRQAAKHCHALRIHALGLTCVSTRCLSELIKGGSW